MDRTHPRRHKQTMAIALFAALTAGPQRAQDAAEASPPSEPVVFHPNRPRPEPGTFGISKP